MAFLSHMFDNPRKIVEEYSAVFLYHRSAAETDYRQYGDAGLYLDDAAVFAGLDDDRRRPEPGDRDDQLIPPAAVNITPFVKSDLPIKCEILSR